MTPTSRASLGRSPVRRVAAALLVATLGLACGGDRGGTTRREAAAPSGAGAPCSAKDDVKHAGRTGLEGAKTGVVTAGEGIKTFGQATAGLVEGGSDEASRRWKAGKAETKATGKEGAAKTREKADEPPCR